VRTTVESRRRLVIAILAAAVLVVGTSSVALAGKKGSGNLDGKFGNKGKVLTTFSAPPPPASDRIPMDSASAESFVIALGQQPSGKLVAMGFHNEFGNDYYALARYIDGALDPTFGSGGQILLPSEAGVPAGMAIQSTGKIILAGSRDLSTSGCQADFLVQRLTVDGAVDTTFGTNGQVVTDFGACDAANTVTVGSDNSIAAAGFSGSGGDVAVARYDADGYPIAAFGGGTATAPGLGSGQGVVIQSGGRVVVGANTDGAFTLVGFTSAGVVDATFGDGGSTSTYFGDNDSGTLAAIALRSNGGIVAVGGNHDFDAGGSYNIAIAAFDASGDLVPSFGIGGLVQTDISGEIGEDQAGGVAIQPDGAIVIGGWTCLTSCDFLVARYLGSNGALDGGFGHGGYVTTDFQSNSGDLGRPVLVQGDGKIVVGGQSDALGSTSFALARYKG
jgi:uncharacterized delta-60 repeat protein